MNNNFNQNKKKVLLIDDLFADFSVEEYFLTTIEFVPTDDGLPLNIIGGCGGFLISDSNDKSSLSSKLETKDVKNVIAT